MSTFGWQLVNGGQWSSPIGNSLQCLFWQQECAPALRFTVHYFVAAAPDSAI
jgi:hypothetical protein